MAASSEGHSQSVRLLLNWGAQVNHQDKVSTIEIRAVYIAILLTFVKNTFWSKILCKCLPHAIFTCTVYPCPE